MNEQDPLAQLRDIHVPEPLGWWPPAPGWWLLAILLLAGIALGLYLWQRRKRANAYRRVAHAAVENAWIRLQQDGDTQAYAGEVNQVLRRAARVAFPGEPVNAMQGVDWLEFLDATGGTGEEFAGGPGNALLTLPYRPAAGHGDLQPLHELVMRWLAEHRRPRGSEGIASKGARHAAV
ncbi:DUF4381 domain-containing protein [Gilvimarinus sp. F26214L]|uniref:DUF4381 domain-containing protein n=1 Tax=Gilvimarinus sp. DZF01 TaxID=3461371 RepID=UPI004045B89E